ncbi:MAG TPA: DedA family protein, partial [Deltaproteobacteria bacterium]|nr:DedA family protein [Deltaproteobacteria bacterium]
METFLLNHGLPALFVLSLLAATVIPLGSEWLLVALLLQGQEL